MDFDRCGEVSNNKIISASENRMKFYIKNKHKISVHKVVVDGCLIKDGRQRCDYLFEINKPFTEVFYLELKGCDIEKAFKQLESTIQICSDRHHGLKKISFIVASRVPKIGTKIQNLKKKFVTKNRVPIHLHTTHAEVVIS